MSPLRSFQAWAPQVLEHHRIMLGGCGLINAIHCLQRGDASDTELDKIIKEETYMLAHGFSSSEHQMNPFLIALPDSAPKLNLATHEMPPRLQRWRATGPVGSPLTRKLVGGILRADPPRLSRFPEASTACSLQQSLCSDLPQALSCASLCISIAPDGRDHLFGYRCTPCYWSESPLCQARTTNLFSIKIPVQPIIFALITRSMLQHVRTSWRVPEATFQTLN